MAPKRDPAAAGAAQGGGGSAAPSSGIPGNPPGRPPPGIAPPAPARTVRWDDRPPTYLESPPHRGAGGVAGGIPQGGESSPPYRYGDEQQQYHRRFGGGGDSPTGFYQDSPPHRFTRGRNHPPRPQYLSSPEDESPPEHHGGAGGGGHGYYGGHGGGGGFSRPPFREDERLPEDIDGPPPGSRGGGGGEQVPQRRFGAGPGHGHAPGAAPLMGHPDHRNERLMFSDSESPSPPAGYTYLPPPLPPHGIDTPSPPPPHAAAHGFGGPPPSQQQQQQFGRGGAGRGRGGGGPPGGELGFRVRMQDWSPPSPEGGGYPDEPPRRFGGSSPPHHHPRGGFRDFSPQRYADEPPRRFGGGESSPPRGPPPGRFGPPLQRERDTSPPARRMPAAGPGPGTGPGAAVPGGGVGGGGPRPQFLGADSPRYSRDPTRAIAEGGPAAGLASAYARSRGEREDPPPEPEMAGGSPPDALRPSVYGQVSRAATGPTAPSAAGPPPIPQARGMTDFSPPYRSRPPFSGSYGEDPSPPSGPPLPPRPRTMAMPQPHSRDSPSPPRGRRPGLMDDVPLRPTAPAAGRFDDSPPLGPIDPPPPPPPVGFGGPSRRQFPGHASPPGSPPPPGPAPGRGSRFAEDPQVGGGEGGGGRFSSGAIPRRQFRDESPPRPAGGHIEEDNPLMMRRFPGTPPRPDNSSPGGYMSPGYFSPPGSLTPGYQSSTGYTTPPQFPSTPPHFFSHDSPSPGPADVSLPPGGPPRPGQFPSRESPGHGFRGGSELGAAAAAAAAGGVPRRQQPPPPLDYHEDLDQHGAPLLPPSEYGRGRGGRGVSSSSNTPPHGNFPPPEAAAAFPPSAALAQRPPLGGSPDLDSSPPGATPVRYTGAEPVALRSPPDDGSSPEDTYGGLPPGPGAIQQRVGGVGGRLQHQDHPGGRYEPPLALPNGVDDRDRGPPGGGGVHGGEGSPFGGTPPRGEPHRPPPPGLGQGRGAPLLLPGFVSPSRPGGPPPGPGGGVPPPPAPGYGGPESLRTSPEFIFSGLPRRHPDGYSSSVPFRSPPRWQHGGSIHDPIFTADVLPIDLDPKLKDIGPHRGNPGSSTGGGLKDMWAGLLFVLQIAAMITFCILFGLQGLTHTIRHYDSPNSFHITDWFPQLAAAAIVGAIFAFAWQNAVRVYPVPMILITIWAGAVGMALFGIILIATGKNWGLIGLLFLFVGLCQALYAFVVSDRDSVQYARVPFAGEMLKKVISVCHIYPSTYFVSYLFVVVALLWLALWIFGLSGSGVRPRHVAIMALFVASLVWTMQVLRNIVRVTVAGTTAMYYFQQGNMPPKPTYVSFVRACTFSFGSICFGSLLVPLVEAPCHALRRINSQAGASEFLFSCVVCLLACFEHLIRYFNRMGYIQVAIYGKPFIRASKNTWDMLLAQQVDVLVHDDLASTILFLACGVGGSLSALVAGIWTFIFHKSLTVAISLISFVIGALMMYVTMAVVESGIATYYVCFAEDPASLQRNDGPLFERMWVRQIELTQPSTETTV